MNNPKKTEKPSNVTLDSSILGEFMNAMYRLFRIGVYYPLGHSILDQALDGFLVILGSLASKKDAIRLEDDGKSLLLEGVPLENTLVFVDEFRQLMATLSVKSIDIDRNISREDLHYFVRVMIGVRSQGSTIQKFSSIEIPELPLAVTITRKEYLTREGASTDGYSDSAAKNLSTFFEALSGYGLTGEQIEQCRNLLSSLPVYMKRLTFKPGELPSVTWDDVALLLARAVKGKPQEKKSPLQGNLDVLASILHSLEQRAEDRKSRETINLLVSILRQPVPNQDLEQEENDSKQPAAGPNFQTVEVGVLQEFVDTNRLASSSLTKIQDIPTEQEALSVLLQVAQKPQSLSIQTRMMQFLHDAFETSPNDKTWEVLAHGVLTIVRQDDRTNLAIVLRMISDALRRSKHADPLEFFLRTLRLCRGREENLLWPFAVNELLISGSRVGTDSFQRLSGRLARLSLREMVRELPVLQSLEAFQHGRVAGTIFPEIAPSCYPLCAFLLKTQIAPRVEGQIIDGLKKNPDNEMIKAVAPVLDLSLPEHKTFLDRYLRQPKQRSIGEELKVLAGDIIVQGLSELPRELREQPWVEETIAATADFQGNGVRELLDRIISEKRFLVMSEWSSVCRKAAEEAMKRLRSKSTQRRRRT